MILGLQSPARGTLGWWLTHGDGVYADFAS
jgi:hypothetical protein